MINEPHVAIVVLNWNRLAETRQCYESLIQQEYRNATVWIVDNGSTMHTVDSLQEACPAATIVSLPANRGFAGGVNAGIRASGALEQSAYVWLVNNDAVCQPDALVQMISDMEQDPKLAAVGCARWEGAPDQKRSLVAGGNRIRRPFFLPRLAMQGEDVDYICGASMLIRTKALQEVGLFDEGYFFFFEDADWCIRARRAGWSVDVLDVPLLYHAGSGTIGALDRLRASYYRSGYVRFLRKFTTHPLLLAFVVTAVRVLGWGMIGKREMIVGTFEGWRKGWQENV